MVNTATELLRYTQEQMASLMFRFSHRTSPKYFTRKSILDFATTMLIILKMVKKSIKVEVMDFFYQLNNQREIPSRQAFSEAREKISYLAFKDLFDKSCELAVTSDEARLYKGYRLFAVDGTSFVVGLLAKLSEYFGHSTSVQDKAMCRISAVVDVVNNCIINATVSPYSTGERALAIDQINHLNSVINAIFMFDRGYWSPDLISQMIDNGQKFLMRISSNNLNVVPDSLRKYSFILPTGKEEILVTNIHDDELSDDELAELYAKRWGIETKYLELKARLQIDEFSGKSVNVVLQDIYSTMYISNLAAFICFEADEVIKEKVAGKSNKYAQKSNRAICIAALRKRFIMSCLMSDPIAQSRELQRLYNDISKCASYVNRSKSRPRNKRQIHDVYRKKRYKSIL